MAHDKAAYDARYPTTESHDSHIELGTPDVLAHITLHDNSGIKPVWAWCVTWRGDDIEQGFMESPPGASAEDVSHVVAGVVLEDLTDRLLAGGSVLALIIPPN